MPTPGTPGPTGPSLFPEGNNQESSSEDANFATAVILWGALTGKPELRDLGIFLHANLTTAIEQYWFDVDGQNFPDEVRPPGAGHGLGQRAASSTPGGTATRSTCTGSTSCPSPAGRCTWAAGPTTSGATTRRCSTPTRASRACGGRSSGCTWRWPTRTGPWRSCAASPHFEPEFGSSRAFTYQWLHALGSYGQVDTTRHRRCPDLRGPAGPAAPATTWPATPPAPRPRCGSPTGWW